MAGRPVMSRATRHRSAAEDCPAVERSGERVERASGRPAGVRSGPAPQRSASQCPTGRGVPIVVTSAQRTRLVVALGILNLVLATMALAIGTFGLPTTPTIGPRPTGETAAESPSPTAVAGLPSPTPGQTLEPGLTPGPQPTPPAPTPPASEPPTGTPGPSASPPSSSAPPSVEPTATPGGPAGGPAGGPEPTPGGTPTPAQPTPTPEPTATPPTATPPPPTPEPTPSRPPAGPPGDNGNHGPKPDKPNPPNEKPNKPKPPKPKPPKPKPKPDHPVKEKADKHDDGDNEGGKDQDKDSGSVPAPLALGLAGWLTAVRRRLAGLRAAAGTRIRGTARIRQKAKGGLSGPPRGGSERPAGASPARVTARSPYRGEPVPDSASPPDRRASAIRRNLPPPIGWDLSYGPGAPPVRSSHASTRVPDLRAPDLQRGRSRIARAGRAALPAVWRLLQPRPARG